MRYLPLVALILLITVAVGAPWLFGRLAEDEFAATVEELDAASERIELRLRKFERHYLSSYAVTELRIHGEHSEHPLVLRLNTDLEHGLTGVRTWTQPDPEQNKVWRELFPERLPELRVEAHAHGTMRARLRIPAFDWMPDVDVPVLAGSSGNFSDFSSRVRLRRGGRLRLQVDWPGATIDVGHSRMTLDELHLTQRLRPRGDTLWTGRGDFSLERFVIDPILDAPIVFEQLTIDNEADLSGNYFDAHWQSSLENLVMGGEAIGRQALHLAVRGFHTPSLDGALTALLALQSAQQGRGDADREMELYRSLSEHLQRLSAHGGDLDIHELRLHLPEGRLEGALHLGYPQLPEHERDQQRSLLEHVAGEGNLVIGREMFWVLPESARAGLTRMRRHGLLREEGDEYLLDVVLEGRELRINDELVIIPPLL